MKSSVGHLRWQKCPMNLILFVHSPVRLSVCNARSQNWLISFFLIFFCMKLGIHKVKKVTIQFFEKKSWRVRRTLKVQKQPRNGVLELLIKMQSNHVSTFLIEYQSTNALLTFCRNSMRGKNVVLELEPKNLWTNQNAGFFQLQYLTNKLRCEAELLYLIRTLFIEATNLCSQFRWMWSDLFSMLNVIPGSESASSWEWVEL